MFAAALFSYVLFATAAFAAPRSNLNGRIARRLAGAHLSGPRLPSDGINALAVNSSNAEHSTNWAGASWESARGTYKSVTGTFVVPTPKAPSGGSGTYYTATAWLALMVILAGLPSCRPVSISRYLEALYNAWYEYYPDFSNDFIGIPISAGNTITLSVTASSATAGTATITNVSTGKASFSAHLYLAA
ncbi:peptidase A4 family-domain-containing protein [Mycena capillaripes]|nr:peptidase A4 family-domain-containing protein [Mycena capillaripes]